LIPPVPVPIFTIDEEDWTTTSTVGEIPIRYQESKLQEWTNPSNYITTAKRIIENGSKNGYLVITPDSIVWLEVHPNDKNILTLQSKTELARLKKITHKKQDPNLLTFQYEKVALQFFIQQP